MLPGTFGIPLAMLLHLAALALPQLLTAVTHTVDPPVEYGSTAPLQTD